MTIILRINLSIFHKKIEEINSTHLSIPMNQQTPTDPYMHPPIRTLARGEGATLRHIDPSIHRPLPLLRVIEACAESVPKGKSIITQREPDWQEPPRLHQRGQTQQQKTARTIPVILFKKITIKKINRFCWNYCFLKKDSRYWCK